MRINLKRQRSSIDSIQKLILSLVSDFRHDYDISDNVDLLEHFKCSNDALDILVKYLTDSGYKVIRYELYGAKKSDILSWGLEFDDKCELFIALKLRFI